MTKEYFETLFQDLYTDLDYFWEDDTKSEATLNKMLTLLQTYLKREKK